MSKSAGRFRSYVRIERDAKVSDGAGGFTLTPESFWEGPAHVERMPSFRGDVERLHAGGVGSHPIVNIHVRYDDLTKQLPLIGSGMRAIDVDSGIPMNITFAQDMTGSQRMVMITAAENLPS